VYVASKEGGGVCGGGGGGNFAQSFWCFSRCWQWTNYYVIKSRQISLSSTYINT